MRYAASENLFRMARLLAGTRLGLTLNQMSEQLGVGRRTAERLRDSLKAMFPEMDSHDDEQRVRRWRLPGSALVGVVEPRAEAFAAIETAARVRNPRRDPPHLVAAGGADYTAGGDATGCSAPRRDGHCRAGGGRGYRHALRAKAGDRPGVLPSLRRAILGMQLVVVRYDGPGTEEPAARILCPYGLLYGGRGWLVAHVDGLPGMRLWRLDRMVSADLLDRGFQRREDFSLSDYAAKSFGVFQEEPINVVLRFTPEAAEDAALWQFHLSQSVTREADGSLTVCFRAGGVQEMCWHLFTWGTAVNIIAPECWRSSMAEMTTKVAHHHSATTGAP